MLTNFLFWSLAGLLALKLLINLLLPYRALLLKQKEGISLGFGLLADWFLVACVVGLSWPASNLGLGPGPKQVTLIAVGFLLLSYVHYFVVLGVATLFHRSHDD